METLAETDLVASWAERAARVLARESGVDGFEVRADQKHDRVLALLDGAVNNSSTSTRSGLGIQIYARGGGAAYAHTVQLDERRVRETIERATSLALANGRRGWRQDAPRMDGSLRAAYRVAVRNHPASASQEDLVRLLKEATEGVREQSPEARSAAAFGSQSIRTIYIDSAGGRLESESLVSTLRVTAALRDAGRVGDGMARQAGEQGIGDLGANDAPRLLGVEAAERAVESLRAESFPAGRYRVLCDNHLAGMLAHESFGHLTEYDLVRSGWSKLNGRRGEQLADPMVSVSDAPVVDHDPRQGIRVPYDDQGVKGRKVTMLRDGVLEGWMHTRDSAAEAGEAPAGNGRALDARYPAIVRMRNTFFEPGDASVEDALEALGDGIYLVGARGGAPHSDGSFMFTSMRGYRVERGRIAAPVRSTAIHGNIFDFLRNVEMLTRDFAVYTNYFGGCGKRDQSFLHVGVGGPHVLVDDALLGGHGA